MQTILNYFIDCTKQFQYVAGQEVDLKGVPENTSALVNFRKNCILEEIEELNDAILWTTSENQSLRRKGREEVLDALVDICYFIAGFYATFPERIPENFLDAQSVFSLQKRLGALECENTEACLKEMSEICSSLFFIVLQLSLKQPNFLKAFIRIHENNMSKFLTSEEEAQKEVAENPELRIRRTEYEGKTYFSLLNSLGKVQKPKSFVPVNLSDLAM